MPNLNGTGPQGAGPMTGRGMGPCNGGQASGRGMRQGFGRGMGRGRCRWFGFGNRQLTQDEEIEETKSYIADLKAELLNAEQNLKDKESAK